MGGNCYFFSVESFVNGLVLLMFFFSFVYFLVDWSS